MKNKMRLTHYLDRHEYPKVLYRLPILVRCIYFMNHVLTLRNWYVRRALRKLEKTYPKKFSFLDAGCGMGEFALGMAERHPSARIVGIDFTGPNISLARRIAESMRLTNIEFLHGDLTNLQAKKEYDVIISSSTLQFIRDDAKALQNLADSLNQQGILLVYVPITYKRYFPWFETLERKYLSDFYYKYHDDFLMHKYTAKDIISKIRNEGLSIQSAEYAYGRAGALAFELYSILLSVMKNQPLVLSVPIVLLYLCTLFPFQMTFMILDYFLPKSSGNGLLIIAVKD